MESIGIHHASVTGNNNTIVASYATGRVQKPGSSYVSGLIGRRITGGNQVIQGYWDRQTTGRSDQFTFRGLPKSAAELPRPTGYSGIYSGWNQNSEGAAVTLADTATVTITVTTARAPANQLRALTLTVNGAAITPDRDTPLDYRISPRLPDGLHFDAAARAIAAIPTNPTASPAPASLTLAWIAAAIAIVIIRRRAR